jgi:hypothetical protein
MSLAIVHYNDPVLRKKGEKITVFDAGLAKFADQMVETMHEARGVGLAAQQVGRAVQLCVVDLRGVEAEFDWKLDGAKPPLELFMPMVVANPKLTVARKTPDGRLGGGLPFVSRDPRRRGARRGRLRPSSRTRGAFRTPSSARGSSRAACCTRSTT